MREKLWPDGPPGIALGDIPENEQPTLEAFVLPKKDGTPNPSIIVCPGGGYWGVCDTYEGVDFARFFNEHGISAFVLRYRVAKWARHPGPLQDAERAIRLVRSRAEEYGIDPLRIGVLGFSAGGHLAATLATHFSTGDSHAADAVNRVSSRPDFAILGYAVISMQSGVTHEGSRNNLLGPAPDPALVESLSNECSIPANAPPCFLVHTDADDAVKAENATGFYLALRKKKIPAEIHIFEKGVHGLGLGGGREFDPKGERGMYQWPKLLLNWMRDRGILR